MIFKNISFHLLEKKFKNLKTLKSFYYVTKHCAIFNFEFINLFIFLLNTYEFNYSKNVLFINLNYS